MSNLKVILLDDEMLIRKLIRMKMNAEELGLEIVGEFSSAKSALEELENLRPDIIISDICMPELDGLSFSEQCTKVLPGVKIIIVTGYNDFEYARRSLKVGVFDYLMKPVQSSELNKTLEKAIAQIGEERRQAMEQEKLRIAIEKGIPVLRRSYINQLLLSEVPLYDMENSLSQYGIKVNQSPNSNLYIGIIAIQESFIASHVVEEVYAEAETFFQGDDYVHVVLDVWGRIVIISDEEECSFEECFVLLLQAINKKYTYHMNSGLSKRFRSWRELRAAYLSALDDMQRNHKNKSSKKDIVSSSMEKVSSDMLKWTIASNYIRTNQLAEAIAEVDHVLYIENVKNDNIVEMKDAVIGNITDLCQELKCFDKSEEYEKMLAFCRTESDIVRCIRFIVMDMMLKVGNEASTEKGQLMLKIVDYIKDNLQQPALGMGDLVSEFCCSSSHLSRMFKQYMGRTYSEYISELRLWKMLALLSDDHEMRDRDIGEMIGITDAHYLSIWFRKMTGFSVTEYRKLK